MEIGKINETILKRAVYKQLRKRRNEVITKPRIGADCSIMELEEDEYFFITSDPITGSVFDIGTLVVFAAANNIAASGAEPIGILLTILLPEDFSEVTLRKIIKEVESNCELLNIEVMGGHTEVTKAVNQPVICVTGIGKAKKNSMMQANGAKAGQDIVVTKWAGLKGTALIANNKPELLNKYTPSFIEEAKNFIQYISVVEESKIGLDYEVSTMHDASEGGIYAALWEVGAGSNVGMEVELGLIPLRQETIELCEFFDLNPYKLNAGGCMVMTTNNGWSLVKALEEKGVKATIIGKITKGNERVVVSDEERRYLEPAKGDELYKL